MTRTYLFNQSEYFLLTDMNATEFVQEYEAHLRSLKGEGYDREAEIVGVSFDRHGRDEGETIDTSDVEPEDLAVSIGVETKDGRRIMTEIPTPSAWDMTSDLVVVLEYLDLEPEDLHSLGNHGKKLPVTFDGEKYCLDMGRMRDELLDSE
ncbi:hypothetical protein HCTV-16_gp62 [Haloarcula virus HCTV-16]|nr:hypothetical protein HCTV-16_gp62 [Haloarcula virus HCTV-16]